MSQQTREVTTNAREELELVEDTRQPDVAELVEEELLVEDVSIDGMCGVY